MVDINELTQRVGRYYDPKIIEPLRRKVVGRKLLAPNGDVKGPGVHSVEVNTLTGMKQATISWEPGQGALVPDSIRLDPSTLQIPSVWKDFSVKRKQVDAWARADGNVKLDATALREATRVVAEREDEMIFNGWSADGSNKDILGLWDVASTEGNIYSTDKQFSTYGNAQDAIAGVMAMIEADFGLVDNYNLVLNPVQKWELMSSRDANGNREWPQVLEMLNSGDPNGPGRIVSTDRIAAGKGMVLPLDDDGEYMEYYNPIGPLTEMGYDSMHPDTCDISGRVYEYVVPHVRRPAALGALTSI